MAAPDVQEVTRIAGIANPVVRNLQITECYSRLAAAVEERSVRCSNWCTFATWASRQAGSTIRGEDLLAQLQRELGRDAELLHPLASLWRALVRHGLFQPGTRLGRLTARLHTPFDAFELASDAVARGNRKVFAEIGLEFARYLHAPDLETFLAGLRPGDPPDGQRYLRQAFTRYHEAGSEADPKRRAELLVLANLEIGLHEQTRLQPEIRAALDAATTPDERLWKRILGWPLQRQLTRLSRRVITHSFLVLTFPDGALALGRHLDAPYPDVLRTPADPDLEALLAHYEPLPPALDDCGAHDWSELQQRMHYIAHLFRAFHERADLASPPFTPEQVERIRAGRLPDGAL
jgi:hypothetical protein